MAAIRVDQELIRTPQYGDHLMQTFRPGLMPGAAGPATDLKLFSGPWDISLKSIESPTRVWLGTEDRNNQRCSTGKGTSGSHADIPRCSRGSGEAIAERLGFVINELCPR